MQTDRLLPIAEMDETVPTSPTASLHDSTQAPQSQRATLRRGASTSPHQKDVSRRPSKRGESRELHLEPSLVPVVYFAVVMWVALCLYLIILHGLALTDSSQRWRAWTVACCVSLMHELLIQQVGTLLLKQLVCRRALPKRETKLASQVARSNHGGPTA